MQVEKSIRDHRSLFIEIPINLLLGANPFSIHQGTSRRLICDYPDVVKKNQIAK